MASGKLFISLLLLYIFGFSANAQSSDLTALAALYPNCSVRMRPPSGVDETDHS